MNSDAYDAGENQVSSTTVDRWQLSLLLSITGNARNLVSGWDKEMLNDAADYRKLTISYSKRTVTSVLELCMNITSINTLNIVIMT